MIESNTSLPLLDLAAASGVPHAVRDGPKTPESPLWSPPAGLYRPKPSLTDDSEEDDVAHDHCGDLSSHPPMTETKGLPIPRTGVRRALLCTKHNGDRSYCAEDAPPHDYTDISREQLVLKAKEMTSKQQVGHPPSTNDVLLRQNRFCFSGPAPEPPPGIQHDHRKAHLRPPGYYLVRILPEKTKPEIQNTASVF